MNLIKAKIKHFGWHAMVNTLSLSILAANFLSPNLVNAEMTTKTNQGGTKAETVITVSPDGLLNRQVIIEEEPDYDHKVNAVITVYTSTPDQTDSTPFIGASGKRVHDGMIAVNGLPFGTKIVIPDLYGDKEFFVEDRMNRRYSCNVHTQDKRCRMDIWLDVSKSEARKFGVKKLKAYISLPEKAPAKITKK